MLHSNKRQGEMNLFQVLLEMIVGRLVLDLPEEDLKKINEMILRNIRNATLQQEDH